MTENKRRGGWNGWRCGSCKRNIEGCHCPTTLSWKWYGPGDPPVKEPN